MVLPQGSILDLTLFLLYINDFSDDVISDIAICADDTTLYSKCDQVYDQWQSLELASELLIFETLWAGAGSGLLISMLEKHNWFHLTGLTTLVVLMCKWMALFLRENHILRCWG